MLKWHRRRTNRTVSRNPSARKIARRTSLKAIAGAFAGLIAPRGANAEGMPFEQWIVSFRAKAMARGITEETYTRVMHGVRPDTTGLEAIHNQAEFNEELWQYINRRVSD